MIRSPVHPALVLLAALAAYGHAAAPPPPPDPERRTGPWMGSSDSAEAIFTYRVDERCRIESPRKLQGPETVRWRDAERALGVTASETVFRYVAGRRTQLRERRVRLLGEMVREGVLICLIRPSGDVVEAWIEREVPRTGRRRVIQQEDVALRDGRIADLGTYSLLLDEQALEPAPAPGTDGSRPESQP